MEAIDRTFKILELFLSNEDELGITQMAELSGLSPAVTHRIVTSLVKKNYLNQKVSKGKYSLGLKFLEYRSIFQKITFSSGAYQQMLNCSRETNETVMLANFGIEGVMCLECAESDHFLQVRPKVAKVLPIHCTSVGKLFLSQLSKKTRESVFRNRSLPKLTMNTITDIKLIEKEIRLFTIEGCMFDREEFHLGVWSVAAPLYSNTGKMFGGISTIVPVSRVRKDNIQKLISATKSSASNISREFGYSDNGKKSSHY
jgi:IclR family transcriptional regulator, KDG regulon repressor